MDLPVSVHGHVKSEWTGGCPGPAISWRACMRCGRPGPLNMAEPRGAINRESDAAPSIPADRPDPETIPMRVDVAAIRAVSGRAAPRKKPTPSSKSRSPAAAPRSPPADVELGHRLLRGLFRLFRGRRIRLFRQRRSVSDETPGSLATSAIAFVSDEYEGRDSVNSLTAFALNSSVYLVPLDMIPSSRHRVRRNAEQKPGHGCSTRSGSLCPCCSIS